MSSILLGKFISQYHFLIIGIKTYIIYVNIMTESKGNTFVTETFLKKTVAVLMKSIQFLTKNNETELCN